MFKKFIIFSIWVFMIWNLCLGQSTDPCSSDIFKNCVECQMHESYIYLYGCLNYTCQIVENPILDETKQKIKQFENGLQDIISSRRNVKTLVIKNSPLTIIPSAVRNLVNIIELRIERCCLKLIPEGLFSGLQSLKNLSFEGNQINHLQSGLFDGLNNLVSINLRSNEINGIDDDVFSNENDLPSLTTLDLSYNNLTSVDAWIFIRLFSMRFVYINLRFNKINSFTNRKKWFYVCENFINRTFNFQLSLYRNELKHISDLLIFFPKFDDAICFFKRQSLGHRQGHPVIELAENAITCDCIDYDLITFATKDQAVAILDGVRCRSPPRHMYSKLFQIPLSEFQCELTPCPDACQCAEIPFYESIYVNCSSKQLKTLPPLLPTKTNLNHSRYHYNLTFSRNMISSMDDRFYLSSTTVLDLSYNELNQFDLSTLMFSTTLEELYLHSNNLVSVPPEFLQKSFPKLKVLTLHDNPWDCSYENKFLKSWMMSLKNGNVSLLHENSILCRTPTRLSGKSIFFVKDEEFANDPKINYRNRVILCILIPLFAIEIFALAIFLILKKFKVKLYTYLNIHPFDRDECTDEYMEYDAFISCAFSDRCRAIELVSTLENRGYKVCYPERDFIPGEPTTSFVSKSRRVIYLLTLDFVNTPRCLFEFQISLQRNLEVKHKRIIVLLDSSLKVDQKLLPNDMFNFLTTHHCIDLLKNNWTNQLFYSLPIKPLRRLINEKDAINNNCIFIIKQIFHLNFYKLSFMK
ncbi:hypothetical protein HELRODRAFT_190054 [Helobdella robusta]|uniref:TIR domain-containing protein n=1 Tax=Helobdella robusta TaxID=6412 RepID=T1FRM5_HELRO|nr:hypothetical protein HELRODRAFT_190054 [Helobdella robusta]ESO11710.1 hypothetical protein HELRODRAFT_190054 [Helobdella robusta]